MESCQWRIERYIPKVNITHRIDVNDDGIEDEIREWGYSFYPRYEVFIQGSEGLSRDTTFSRKDITSKLN